MNDIEDKSVLFSAEAKPNKAINNVHYLLKSSGTAFSLYPKQLMRLSDKRQGEFVLLFESGCFSFFNEKEKFALATSFAPTVVGLVDACNSSYGINLCLGHCIVAETNCSGIMIPSDVFVDRCNKFNLWRDIAEILVHRLMSMSIKQAENIGKTAYDRIRTLLLELASYPEDIRMEINVIKFVLLRTKISKSRIMSILSELRMGGYIKIEKGILVSVSRLPTGYKILHC